MKYKIDIRNSANDDLLYYDTFEQRIIVEAILKYLQFDANIETRKRKQLRSNPIAPWVLKIGKYRTFYEVTEGQKVKVLAIGHKKHNELFIRGRKVQI